VPHDPRTPPVLLPRDAAALAFIGRGYEVAQYQLRAAVFPGLSEVVASRRVRRWVTDGLITVERFQGFGINRLRLTEAGKDAVVASGIASEDELFVPSKAVALKDLAHTLWINDLRVLAAEGLPFVADRVAPAWYLQRTVQPVPPAIPDLLLVRRPRDGKRGTVLAMEVDLGGERLKATFLPKLALLAGLLQEWAGESARPAIVVLTRGPRRLASMQEGLDARALPVRVVASLLPSAAGGEALAGLRAVLRGGVSSTTQPPAGVSPPDAGVPSSKEAEGTRGLSGETAC
jgi:hypothetical protein